MTRNPPRWLAGWIVAAFVATLLGLGAGVPAHAAVPVTKVGWWTRSPAPPTVPSGGLSVGQAPDGTLSVAAFELDTGGGASGAKLTLVEKDGQGQQAASLQACPTADGWAAVSGGDLVIAPRPSCPTPPTTLTRDSSGNWTVDLTPLLAGKTGPVSIMIVPAPAAAALPGGAQTGAFQVAFDPPAVAGTRAAPLDSTDFGSSAAPSFAPAPLPEYFPAVGQPTEILPVAPSATASPSLPAAPVGTGGATASFPIRASGTPHKSKSRLVIVAWLALAAVIGAAAAGWRWAREAGVLERLIPLRTGGNLLPPPG